MRRIFWSLPIVFLAACSSSDDDLPPNDGGIRDSGLDGSSSSGDAASGDAGPSDAGSNGEDGGVMEPSTPILERTARNDYSCAIVQDTTALPNRWARLSSDIAASSSGTVWAARTESTGLDWNQPSDFFVSTLDANGELGPDLSISGDPTVIQRVQVVGTSSGAFAVMWIEGSALRFAAFDAAGTAIGAPKTIDTVQVDSGSDYRAAFDGVGSIGVIYSRTRGNGSSIHMVTIDPLGTPAHTPLEIVSSDVQVYLRSMNISAAGPASFAMLYADGEGFETDVYFARARGGAIAVPSKMAFDSADRGGAGGSFAAGRVAMLKNATGFLVAWSEGSFGDFETQTGAYSVVRLARMDTDGALLEHALVRARIDNVEQLEPELVMFRSSVALSWARGSVIYVCGGCIPDHSIEMVLIDPDELVPVSNVVKVDPNAGGLLRRSVAVSGNAILTTFEITFHVTADPGFASFGCD
jgi:hypothetical protein